MALAKNEVVDPKSPKYDLKYLKGNIQYVKDDFILTTTSCVICQESFSSNAHFYEHLKYHGRDKDFYLEGICENGNQVFKISYKLCIDSYFLQFTVESTKAVIIEKVVAIRPDVQRSINYINDDKVPFRIGNGGSENFFVNCYLFDIHEEHPFIIVYRFKDDDVLIRRIEHHIFFRETDFPKCSTKLLSTRVPERGMLELKRKIKPNFPTATIARLSKLNFREEEIMRENAVVGQYLLEQKLKQSNFERVLFFLLQIEDHSILSSYKRLNQYNKAINQTCNEYSVTIKKEHTKGNIKVGEIASAYDDIILSHLKEDDKKNERRYRYESTYDFYYSDDDDGFSDCQRKRRKLYLGVITKIEGDTVFFELRQRKKLPERLYDIKILPQRISIKYQYNALDKIAENRNIRSLLFPITNFNKTPSMISLELYNKSIENNPEQLQAVMNIAEGPNGCAPYIIFGPPGTGKTTTVVESTYQLWKINPSARILITAGSNAACDEVARRLCKIFDKLDNQERNILRIYAASSEKRADNIDETLLESSNLCYGSQFYPSLESIYLYRIIVVTLTVAGKLVQGMIRDTYFTHIFIDECAASTEPEAMTGIVGLLSPKAKLILSGDPKQLGPVLTSQYAESFGLGVSMMERLLNENLYKVDDITGEYDKSIQTRLRRNFRSHPDILRLSNKMYYDNQLIPCAGKDITHWALGWNKLPSKKFPIIFHSIDGATKRDEGQTSLRNEAELNTVMHYVFILMKRGLKGRKIKQEDIGIISPYKRQCDILRARVDGMQWFQIEIGSVETFQGKEKPIIIVSTVRSNTHGVGFLDNPKRLNVTLTRAQALLIIIGNPRTLQAVEDWREVIKYCQENKAMTGEQFNLEEIQNIEANALPSVPKFPHISSIKNNNKSSENDIYLPQTTGFNSRQNGTTEAAIVVNNSNVADNISSAKSTTKEASKSITYEKLNKLADRMNSCNLNLTKTNIEPKTETKFSFDEKKILFQHIIDSSLEESIDRVTTKNNNIKNQSSTITENKVNNNKVLKNPTTPAPLGAVKKQPVLPASHSKENSPFLRNKPIEDRIFKTESKHSNVYSNVQVVHPTPSQVEFRSDFDRIHVTNLYTSPKIKKNKKNACIIS